ncbi:hypothetical protein AKG11_32010 [Shinella sp. SUS2]|nr:hypothetical protein AKG11_32010 [Shinella sp. SUS2]KOC71656.1 hypothetical protein AKG10_31730 [Shinella sp. GWS1]
MSGNHKDSSEIALNVDLHLAFDGGQHDPVHERAQDVRCLDPLLFLFILQGFVELLDAVAVLQRHGGMEKRRRLFGLGQEQRQFLLPGFQQDHLRVDGIRRAALEDQVEQCIELPVDPGHLRLGRSDPRAAFHAQPVHFLGEHLAEPGEQFGINKAGAEGVQYPRFEFLAPNVDAVVAGSLVACRRATNQRG